MIVNKPVPISSIIEVLQAAHLTYCVDSPFSERSGILLVSPAGQLKTSMLTAVNETFHNFKLVSDLNGNNLLAMQDDLFSGTYPTIAFKDMIKLYERAASTSSNLEGTLRSMVDEGWTGSTQRDTRIAEAPIRLLVMGGMTKAMYDKRLSGWIDSGFARRFIWCHYKLDDPAIIGNAIEQQTRIQIAPGTQWPQATRRSIPFKLDERDRRELRLMMKEQIGKDGTPYNLLLKVAVVLRWRAERQKRKEYDHMKILRDFGRLLTNKYAEVTVDQ
jgi:hypothetical protein